MHKQSIWSYISSLRPQLRGHVQVYTQTYRKQRWYILHDQSSEQYLRFNERAYSILGRFNGVLTLEEILDHANEAEKEYPFTQDDVIGLLGQLDAAEVLKGGLPVNAQDVFQQYKTSKKKKRQRSFMNPLSIKIPLFDPDKFLTLLAPVGRILFSRVGFGLWLSIVIFALLLGLTHISDLAKEIATLQFSPEQLIAVWFIYPFIKVMHEIGHGLAIKTWGGEVHEVGINLLVFMPVPYIDATASLSFGSKWKRMIVGASGILVELFLAALALFLWLSVEPGMVKTAALDVILIATLSTVLFNGNPLLRYDGYFVLEDGLEIPNLATRARRYYYYLIQKYILNIQTAVSPVTGQGEEKWFLIYGLAAPVYRFLILFGIALYLVDSFLVIGVALAVWVVFMQVLMPIIKAIKFLGFSKVVAEHRIRAMGLIVLCVICFGLFMRIPFPMITYTEGVLWTSGHAQVTAGTSGFVKKVLLPKDREVNVGQSLFQLEDDVLQMRYETVKYKLYELKAKSRAEEHNHRVKAAMLKDDIVAAQAEYDELFSQIKKLNIKSDSKGKFVSARLQDFEGSYVTHGEVFGHIINAENIIIKAVIPQARIGLLETYNTSVEFVLAKDMKHIYKSHIVRKIPKASMTLVSPVLGTVGGGKFTVDTRDTSGTKLLVPVFQIDLSVPKTLGATQIGHRVYVRLNHGYLPISEQISLRFHQLFLRHFYIK